MWVQFFNRRQSAVKQAIDVLLEADRAALIGPIVAEVLLGFRKNAQADWIASALQGIRYLDLSWRDWLSAARLGRQLLSNGHELPLSDLAVATVALAQDCSVYTTDPHFDLIPNLKRFRPESDS
jgi:predicted nucleic acid-binding protein